MIRIKVYTGEQIAKMSREELEQLLDELGLSDET